MDVIMMMRQLLLVLMMKVAVVVMAMVAVVAKVVRMMMLIVMIQVICLMVAMVRRCTDAGDVDGAAVDDKVEDGYVNGGADEKVMIMAMMIMVIRRGW